MKKELKILAAFVTIFLVAYLLPLANPKVTGAILEAFKLLQWYARNFAASSIGCLFYFATLTEIPILETLMKNGMGSGPALALLLAGPALSIPSILVIRSILGNVKTAVFVALVVLMSTIVGMGYGRLFPANPVTHAPAGPPTVVATSQP